MMNVNERFNLLNLPNHLAVFALDFFLPLLLVASVLFSSPSRMIKKKKKTMMMIMMVLLLLLLATAVAVDDDDEQKKIGECLTNHVNHINTLTEFDYLMNIS